MGFRPSLMSYFFMPQTLYSSSVFTVQTQSGEEAAGASIALDVFNIRAIKMDAVSATRLDESRKRTVASELADVNFQPTLL